MEDVKEDESVECIGEALNPTENLIGEKAEPASINFILQKIWQQILNSIYLQQI